MCVFLSGIQDIGAMAETLAHLPGSLEWINILSHQGHTAQSPQLKASRLVV